MMTKMLMFAAFAATTYAQNQVEPDCALIADIAFLFDKSGSISDGGRQRFRDLQLGQARFDEMKTFVDTIITGLPVSKDEVHVSFTTFNSIINTGVSFNSAASYTKASIDQSWANLQYTQADTNGNTFLGQAMYEVDQLFDGRSAARKDVPKIIFILTDGEARDRQPQFNAVTIGNRLRGQENYHVFALGIGNINRRQLIDITGGEQNIFESDFNKIFEQIKGVSEKICSVGCEVGDWSEWGSCKLSLESKVCSEGFQTRTRAQTQAQVGNGNPCPQFSEQKPCPLQCDTPDSCDLVSDLTLMFDMSGSISFNDGTQTKNLTKGIENFNTMKQFAQLVMSGVNVGAEGTHVAITDFNNEFHVNSQYSSSHDAITNTLNRLTYDNNDMVYGSTMLEAALKKTNEQILPNGRPNTPRVLLIMADGQANDNPIPEAQKLRAEGTTILALGIGSGVDAAQLEAITGSKEYVFYADSFDTIFAQIAKVSEKLCAINCEVSDWSEWGQCSLSLQSSTCGDGLIKRTRTVTTQSAHNGAGCPALDDFEPCSLPCDPITECDIQADITFMFDKSGSISFNEKEEKVLEIGTENFKLMKSFANLVIETIPVSSNTTHVSFTDFNNQFHVNMGYNYDKATIKQSLAEMQYDKDDLNFGSTKLENAFKKINAEVLPKSRANIPEVIILLTDGVATDEPLEIAQEIRDDNVTILALGIGSGVDKDQLNAITGSPDNVFLSDDFAAIFEHIAGLAKQLCNVDCKVSEWADWSQCTIDPSVTATCGAGLGQMTRNREIDVQSQHNGATCAPLTESKTCDIPCAPCTYSEWGEWSDCSVEGTCGEGKSIRSRTVTGGDLPATCTATDESQTCNVPCPVESSNVGVIAGAAAGAVAGVAAAAAAAAYFYKQHVAKQAGEEMFDDFAGQSDANPLFQSSTNSYSNQLV
eukprot:Pgem_evm1s1147